MIPSPCLDWFLTGVLYGFLLTVAVAAGGLAFWWLLRRIWPST